MVVDQDRFDRALARNCSTMASGNGIPATSAGPDRGTPTTNSGGVTAIGVSTRSATATASHMPASASAARCSNDSHA